MKVYLFWMTKGKFRSACAQTGAACFPFDAIDVLATRMALFATRNWFNETDRVDVEAEFVPLEGTKIVHRKESGMSTLYVPFSDDDMALFYKEYEEALNA